MDVKKLIVTITNIFRSVREYLSFRPQVNILMLILFPNRRLCHVSFRLSALAIIRVYIFNIGKLEMLIYK